MASSKSSNVTKEYATIEQMLDIDTAEHMVGEPASKWHGRCYEIAVAISECLLGAAPVYGHWTGPVDPDGWWGRRGGSPFVQHGWIIFKGRSEIMDPTRFSFEHADPYIYFGEADHYDEGGNDWRSAAARPCPEFNFSNGSVTLTARPDSSLARHLDALMPDIRMATHVVIDKKQAFWLANAHYARLEPFAKEIYLELEKHDLRGFVPIDNWNRAFRKWDE
jgi:hypothetical protein